MRRSMTIAATLLAVALPKVGHASLFGSVTTYSGKTNVTCAQCHNQPGASSMATVTVAGPTELAPGASGSFTATLTGGGGMVAGAAIAVDNGATLAPGDGTLKKVQNDLQHSQGIPFTSTSAKFKFNVTAPAGGGDVTVFIAANSADNNGMIGGDRIATTTYKITVAGGSANPGPTPGGGNATDPGSGIVIEEVYGGVGCASVPPETVIGLLALAGAIARLGLGRRRV